jgi:tetratricopeptide (TPR) repeat protein
MGNFSEALNCMNTAIELNPLDSESYAYKGIVLNTLELYEEALFYYDKAIDLNPIDSLAYKNKRITLINLGRRSEALACYNFYKL